MCDYLTVIRFTLAFY